MAKPISQLALDYSFIFFLLPFVVSGVCCEYRHAIGTNKVLTIAEDHYIYVCMV